MYLMSIGRHKPAWCMSFLGNIGWIYLAFSSGLTGMAFYSIVMLGIALKGLWKYLSVETRHNILSYFGLHSEYSNSYISKETHRWVDEIRCNDCSYGRKLRMTLYDD
jgi:hypothetical protein